MNNYLLSTFIILLGLSSHTLAQEFIFEHSDCKVRMKKTYEVADLSSSEIETLEELVSKELEKRDFEINPFIDNKRILEGELYIDWDVDFSSETVYKSCIIGVSLNQAKGQTPRNDDPVLYKKTIKRRVPRITFEGMERCKLAIKESFIHIPTCRKIGFYGEKK